MMLGLGSAQIALAFWLSVAATILCAIYGIVNRNNNETDKTEGGAS